MATFTIFTMCLLFMHFAVGQLVPDPLPIYSPARPPAFPLAVRSPYTNAWTSTRHPGVLESTTFWNGEALGWEGIITVDNHSYEYLGSGLQSLPARMNFTRATPTNITYDSQWSNFTFLAGPVELTACFFSPVIPQDTCRTSIPLSYLYVKFHTTDGKEHDVKFYSDVNGAWLDPDGQLTLRWENDLDCFKDCEREIPSPYIVSRWIASIDKPSFLGESDKDFPLWGHFTYTSLAGFCRLFTYQSGYGQDLRDRYLTNYTLSRGTDQTFRSSTDKEPVFAFAHDMSVRYNGSVLYTIGSIQTPAAQYLGTDGLSKLEPWWTRCYGSILKMITFHIADFATASAKGAAFEAQLRQDIDSYYADNSAILHFPDARPPHGNVPRDSTNGTDQFGQDYQFDPYTAYGYLDTNNFSGIAIPDVSEADSYYAIVALSARQVMGGYVLTVPPPPACNASFSTNQSEPFMFQKEISSNGNMNTVDVIFPAMPFFLYTHPELIRFLLEPVFLNQEAGFYPNGWAAHDLGTNFPNGIGHVDGADESMPVEECGNMLTLAYAYYKFTGNAAFLKAHYPIMQRWATYLNDYSLVPESQLSTDDFAGTLTNQTNLAIKGIIGVKAMSLISEVVGNTTAATLYNTIATDFFQRWTEFAIDPSGRHTLLAYQLRSSWGLLYNTYPDKLLNLGVIPDSLYEMQSDFYPTVSQIFGVPLDSRHSYTKSDWEMWTAAACSPSTRRLFVNALAYWLNNTETDLPMTDLYETIGTGYWPQSPADIRFIARPVVGGHFSLLALLKAGEDSASGTSDQGSAFDEGETDPILEEQAYYVSATASDNIAILSALRTLTGSIGDFNGAVSSHAEAPTVLDTRTSTWTTSSTMTGM